MNGADKRQFHRTWVIQEIANAREATIHVGRFVIPWAEVAHVIFTLKSYHLDYPIADYRGLKSVGMMHLLRSERVEQNLPHSSMDLVTLAEELRDFKSTLPSDKIYGIVGLTSEKDKLAVDYSLTPEQVFTSFAISRLESSSSPLSILSHCVEVPSKPRLLNLPSWVPDWTRAGHVEPFRARQLRCNACGPTAPDFEVHAATNTLHIGGRLLDYIDDFDSIRPIPPPRESYGVQVPTDPGEKPVDEDGHAVKSPMAFDPATRNARRVQQRLEASRAYYRNIFRIAACGPAAGPGPGPGPDSDPDPAALHETLHSTALWRTFMCNRTRDNEAPDPSALPYADGFIISMGAVLSEDKGPRQLLREQVAHEVAEHGLAGAGAGAEAEARLEALRTAHERVAGATSRWCHNRRFFRSERGRFGWAVDGIRKGDAIAMFYGAEYLFVLRPAADGPGSAGRWKIVGDCWMDGFGDGEGAGAEWENAHTRFIIA